MKQPRHTIRRMAERMTAVLVLAVIVVAGIAAGPMMANTLRHSEIAIPMGPAGSLPVIVDWALILGSDSPREADHAKKCAGRARRADGTARASSRACDAAAQ